MLSQKLAVKAAPSLVISKQLQQSLKILQMTSLELNDYITAKIEENPYIDLKEEDVNPTEDLRYDSVKTNKTTANEDVDYLSKLVPNDLTLREHLQNQIIIEIHDPAERVIALKLTELLDDNGYILEDFSPLAKELRCSNKTIIKVLQQLQNLDPAGVYARSLMECLSLQLKELNLLNSSYQLLLENLELVARGEIHKLAKIVRLPDELIKNMILTIKKLNPKPGINFSKENPQTLIPDAFIYSDVNGNLRIKLNTNLLPNILLNTSLYKNSLDHSSSKDAQNFCKSKFQEATFLSRALEQRAETIFSVANAIAEIQIEFFEKGVTFLKPMTLAQIAKATNLHESTISRVNNKVLATPAGTFEIKYFFTSKITSNVAENTFSSTAIKKQIRTLIEKENPQEILADDKIAIILKKQGINISRRTVTKYREAMKIFSSHERKRYKIANS